MNSDEHEEAEEKAEGQNQAQAAEDIESLKATIEKERETAEQYLTRLKYLQADFENYRKRVQREVEEASRLGSERLIVNLLTVIDDLERAVDAGRKADDKKLLLEGLQMVINQLKDTLKREGLNTIDAMGKAFNPALHEAVAQVETDEFEDNIIVEELRRGYTFNNKVIRPSMVKVARAPTPHQTRLEQAESLKGVE